jgi:hypothetical protein
MFTTQMLLCSPWPAKMRTPPVTFDHGTGFGPDPPVRAYVRASHISARRRPPRASGQRVAVALTDARFSSAVLKPAPTIGSRPLVVVPSVSQIASAETAGSCPEQPSHRARPTPMR